ncbi:MAG: hypothetical protein Q3972_08745 [Corynebacterium sp.]|nr:hypothetical protein [Corynebacterium sp.]
MSASVIVLFIIAGLLTGGTYSMYQQGHKFVCIMLGLVTAALFAYAVISLLQAGGHI